MRVFLFVFLILSMLPVRVNAETHDLGEVLGEVTEASIILTAIVGSIWSAKKLWKGADTIECEQRLLSQAMSDQQILDEPQLFTDMQVAKITKKGLRVTSVVLIAGALYTSGHMVWNLADPIVEEPQTKIVLQSP